jgi:hypothetical protein
MTPLAAWRPEIDRLVDALHAAERALLQARTDHDQVGIARAHRRRSELLRRIEAARSETMAHDRHPAPAA